MSVWRSYEKLCIFAHLISPSKIVLFCLRSNIKQSTQSKFEVEVRQKYSAASRIFNSLLGVSSCGETLPLMLDILLL